MSLVTRTFKPVSSKTSPPLIRQDPYCLRVGTTGHYRIGESVELFFLYHRILLLERRDRGLPVSPLYCPELI